MSSAEGDEPSAPDHDSPDRDAFEEQDQQDVSDQQGEVEKDDDSADEPE
jgi:hypothetical protein